MKHTLPILALLAIAGASLLPAAAQTGTAVPELARFDTAMTRLLAQYKVPGGQLAITYKGRLVYDRGFGYADTAAHVAVRPDHVFRLASLSKQITSIALMGLMEKGKVRLGDTVFGDRGILNDTAFASILDARVRNITVQNLLEHSGGWNRDLAGDPMFDSWNIATAMGAKPPADPETVIRYVLSRKSLNFAPGAEYSYSNFGYLVLGRVIEKITGKPYGAYVRDSVLLPLGIADMRLGANLEKDKLPDEVDYYDYPNAPMASSVYDNSTPAPWPYGGFNLEAMDSHGGWVASAHSLCRLLTAVDGFPTVPDILSAQSIATMTKPSKANAYYALGWSVNPANNWWHTGSLPGTATEIVRGSNELNWAILLNTRPANSDPLFAAMDNLVWSVLPSIKDWPSHDLFATAVKPVPRRAIGKRGFARKGGRLVVGFRGRTVDARGAAQPSRNAPSAR